MNRKTLLLAGMIGALALLGFVLHTNAADDVTEPEVVSSAITGPNTVTIVFTEPVVGYDCDYGGSCNPRGSGRVFIGAFGSPEQFDDQRIVVASSGNGTDTITLEFNGAPVGVDAVGWMRLNALPATIQDLSGNELAGYTQINLADGQNAATVFVDDDYTNIGANEGHTWGYDAFDTVGNAVEAVAAGGTVHVSAGVYEEAGVDIEKNGIQIIGPGLEGDPATIVSDCQYTFGIYASNVRVEGLYLVQTSGGGIADPYCTEYPVVVVGGCYGSGGSCAPEDVAMTGTEVTGNDISGGGRGINVRWDAAEASVSYNVLHDNNTGIAISDSRDNYISSNIILNNNNDGVYVRDVLPDYESTGTVISGNNIQTNDGNGIRIEGSNGVIVSGNDVNYNGASGILLDESTANELRGNSTIGNVRGIRMLDSSDNVIAGNFARNSSNAAFVIEGGSDNNEILGNIITNNPYGLYHIGGDGTIINGNTIGSAWVAGSAQPGNGIEGIYIAGGSNIAITNNQIKDNGLGPMTGIRIDSGVGTGNSAHFNTISGNAVYGLYSDSTEEFDMSDNFWGSSAGPGADGNNMAASCGILCPLTNTENLAQDTVVIDDSFDIPNSLIYGGVFDVGSAPIDEILEIEVIGSVSLRVGDSSIFLPDGTSITRTDLESFNGASFSARETAIGDLSGLGNQTVVGAALQWGLPNIGLSFSPAITLHIFVGTEQNGKTLNILRSTDGQGGWTSDGIVAPATCVVANGTCTFQATQASTYAPTTTSSGGSTGSLLTAEQLSKLFGLTTGLLSQHGLREGDVIRASEGDPDVYIVNAWGYKRLFLNPVIFGFYGHLGGWEVVKTVAGAVRDAFGTSGLFTNCSTNDGKVYALEVTGEDTGTLHHVALTGDQAVAQDADFFKKVFCINDNEFGWYTKSPTPYTALDQMPAYSR